MAKTLEELFEDANDMGLAVHNCCQLSNGLWRVSFRVFEATDELARNPTYTDYMDGEDLAECIERVLRSKRYRDQWTARAEIAREAMERPSLCIATLRRSDREAVAMARAESLGKLVAKSKRRLDRENLL